MTFSQESQNTSAAVSNKISQPLITIKVLTSFVQYNRPCLPVLFWRVVFRNRTGIIHFRLMRMISFQCKTAKNQFYLLMMLIVNKTLLNLRSQNRTRSILGPSIFASSYFQYKMESFTPHELMDLQFLYNLIRRNWMNY